MDLNTLMPQEKWLEFGTDFCEHSGMNTFAFDHAGEHIPGKGKWANQFCPVVRGHAQRAGRICIATYETLAQAASAKRQIVVDRCGAGMLVFGVPVYVGDEYAGLVGGCGLLPPESEVDADAVSRATGMDKALVEQLAASVGEISRYDAETWIRFMEDRVRELVNRYKRGSSTMTSIKTFKDLVAEVQRRGLCHQCGGCVTFCSAMNYGALELSETGRPRFRDPDKCIQCGICYMICPEVDMLDNEVRRRLQWTEPAGRVLETVVARARDEDIRRRATDGGAVTAILTHLINEERIDGAAVTRQAGPFKRQPFLATSAAEIVESAGSHFDRSQMSSLAHYTQDYSTYSPSVRTLGPVVQKGLSRVAMVGTPCQINTVRKMQALGVAPSDSIHCTLGLFCSGNYVFGDRRREKIERMGDFKWSEVDKINIKDECIIRLKNGETRSLPLEDLDFVKRRACHFCADYGAEYADISFGGIGAEEGWTTVVTRTELGQSILDQALQTVLDLHPDMEDMRDGLQETVERHALAKKRDAAEFKRANLTDAAA